MKVTKTMGFSCAFYLCLMMYVQLLVHVKYLSDDVSIIDVHINIAL